MPIYEYRCTECGQKARKFWRTFSDIDPSLLECPGCGAHSFQRLISRVAVIRSEESRLEDLADPSSLAGLDEDDPKSIARWMRKMSKQVGEEMPTEFDEVIDRLEAGQSPEEIEASMPEFSEGMGDMGRMGKDGFVDL
ncbi:MAG: zinc ribbon domain-containing protein [Anaerolineae bacterium]|nr:zinc ribbon domain-containing protein [Anaerolineae bacterium]